ncbi:hypothetical protein RFI_20697 [Reticulomyxa filosa]|uniref:Uncharacterized protein n=1 Tax=Reticulomyxa filosa TaxID=46433 RepID=X6MU40_RETFI|nr:hypothetical protein RFI_20697 [Reticulomyxa filosa]|eukprot:ETO16640.1 hypothetical protein RFI_20697 [Reticulomyxa filosa]
MWDDSGSSSSSIETFHVSKLTAAHLYSLDRMKSTVEKKEDSLKNSKIFAFSKNLQPQKKSKSKALVKNNEFLKKKTIVQNHTKKQKQTFANSSKRPSYGAWYLPVEKWKAKTKTLGENKNKKGQSRTTSCVLKNWNDMKKLAVDDELTKKEKALKEKIRLLFSSKMYKQHILSFSSPSKRTLPHYLKDVKI